MRVSREPSALLRIFVGTFALLWLLGPVFSIGCDCNCAGHGKACAADASPIHEQKAVIAQKPGHTNTAEAHEHATASHHDDGEAPQGQCDKNGCDDKCCCPTIQAFVQTPSAVVISKTVSQPVLIISLRCKAREHVFAAPPSETLRRGKPRDWVFTPVVCLGPAFRSLAPPAFV